MESPSRRRSKPQVTLSSEVLYRKDSGDSLGGTSRLADPHPGSMSAGRRKSQAPTNCNVKVMVRVRPFSDKEIALVRASGTYMQSVIDMRRSDQVLLLDHEKDYTPKQAFNFDTVLWSVPDSQQKSPIGFADQQRVFEETGAVALDAAWEGMNSCIFAYGQTGSGKTHTMMGNPASIAEDGGCSQDESGVIPRLCKALFQEKHEHEANASRIGIKKGIELEVMFIEIYNEQVYDLLTGCPVQNFVRDNRRFTDRRQSAFPGRPEGDYTRRPSVSPDPSSPYVASPFVTAGSAGTEHGTRLQVREHPTEGPQVSGATIAQPSSYEEIIDTINYGNKQRHVAETKMNDRSSRSHAMFRITLRQLTYIERERAGIGGPQVDTSERRANINLVDLAGSENTKRSGAQGSTMVEAQKINLSLTTLRRVIDALIERKRGDVIPYRDSTLTWLLRQDLGGNSQCFMLATVSPHLCNAHESQRTLEYAMRARAIVNAVKVNEDDTAAMLRDLEKRLEEKQRAIVTEEVSEEQRRKMQQEIQEAQDDKKDLDARIKSMQTKAEQLAAQEKKVRHEKVRQTLRHVAKTAVVQQAAERKRQQLQQQEDELAKIRHAAHVTGHADVNDLAASLVMNREQKQRVQDEAEQLRKQFEEMQAHEQEMQAQHEQRKRELAKRVQALVGSREEGKGESAERLKEIEQQEKDRTQELLQMYEDQIKDAERMNAAAVQKVRDTCQRDLKRMVAESEREYQQQIGMMQRQIDAARRETRDEREKAALHLRSIQDDEAELRGQVSWTQREAEKSRRELHLLRNTSHDSKQDLEKRLQKQQARVAELRQQLQDAQERADTASSKRDAEMRALAQQVADAEQTSSDAQDDLEAKIDAMHANEVAYQKTADKAKDVLDGLRPETVQTIDDARAAVYEYCASRRQVTSVKPKGSGLSARNHAVLIPVGDCPRLGSASPHASPRPTAPANGYCTPQGVPRLGVEQRADWSATSGRERPSSGQQPPGTPSSSRKMKIRAASKDRAPQRPARGLNAAVP